MIFEAKKFKKKLDELEEILYDDEESDELEHSADLDDFLPPAHGHRGHKRHDDPYVESLMFKIETILEKMVKTDRSGGYTSNVGQVGQVQDVNNIGTAKDSDSNNVLAGSEEAEEAEENDSKEQNSEDGELDLQKFLDDLEKSSL